MATAENIFQPVGDHRGLSERIIAQIANAIRNGELRPGDKLPTERDLAEQFGVSRTVVRDSVKVLAGRGILQIKHGSGMFVTASEDAVADRLDIPLHDSALSDLFEVRKVLETESAELAALRRSDSQLQQMNEVLEDAHRHVQDIPALSLGDARFHLAISEASQNPVFVKLTLTLLDLFSRTRQQTLSIQGRAEQSLVDHERIVRAVADRDSAGARTAMLAHLISVEASVNNTHKQGASF